MPFIAYNSLLTLIKCRKTNSTTFTFYHKKFKSSSNTIHTHSACGALLIEFTLHIYCINKEASWLYAELLQIIVVKKK